ncbi:hypothetical protein [Hyunsoonleella pacifica]|uniref:Uncharacterized protein n=1 Tax=Hyunsoonleella pacifica TaxID=1080224 RepID=A0A4Q9FPZ8_9FLAO|nr:hypothetical protein [Hyunsoonleella pacifica]TBN14739.1 hypothetical protein EYD46_14340 [Hyunsoonleella pacifica]GGD16285.1 TonB-dependent receptor [Hyunsoonleella pacifica]
MITLYLERNISNNFYLKFKYFFFIFVLCFTSISQSQTNTPIANKQVDKKTYAEKIYLQLSNTICATGETVWFKAIVTNTLNVPSKRSGILHVELIDFDENVLSTKKLKLENGIAESFFDLDEKLPSGRYLIRAYTKWNRNFEADFIFKQYIDVFSIQPIDKQDVITDIVLSETNNDQLKITVRIHPERIKDGYNKDLNIYILSEDLKDSVEVKRVDKQYVLEYSIPKDLIKVELKVQLEDTKLKNRKRKTESTYSKTIALNKDFLDVQFFPEGGKMLEGFTNKIAYKSIDYEGLGKVVSGHIVDETDSIVTPFTTNKLGMGFVYFKPDKQKTYYGKIIRANGVEYKYPLPKVMALGYLLSVSETSKHLSLSIKSKIKTKDSLYVEVKSKGVLIQQHNFTLEQGIHKALIKKAQLPNGIISVTLFNNSKVPISERLFFNLDEKSILNIAVKEDKTIYAQRDKTTLNLDFTDKENQAIVTNFSALVIDKAKLNPNRNEHPNILSYFLLHSELKGFIEQPSIYFDTNNMYRKRDLDALMLTQGWRNYVFSKSDTSYNFDIQPETALSVSGKVRSAFNDKKPPKKKVNLTMLTSGEPQGLYMQTTDSIGNFVFNLGNHYADELDILIQSSNKKGKAKQISFELDKAIPIPKIAYKREEVIALPDTIVTAFLKKKTEERRASGGFNLSDDTVELGTVELTGYNVTPEREKLFKLHGAPDIVIDNEELVEEEEDWMSGLYDLLRTKFPDDVYFENVSFPGEAFGLSTDPSFTPQDTIVKDIEVPKIAETNVAFVFIDGELIEGIDYPLLPFLAVENIKSVEILKRPKANVLQYYQEAFPRNDPFEIAKQRALAIVGIISIYTYGSNGIAALGAPKGVFKGTIAGFSTQREFYAPKYETLKPEDWDIPDLRSVTYWVPSIYTNEKGEAQLEFYNDDTIGDKLIIIEAISPDGKIGYFETSYTIEKRLENN